MQTNSIKPEEALSQIAYLKDLANQSILKLAMGYPFFIVWGILWILGNIGNILLPGKYIGWMWFGVNGIGAIASMLIGIKIGHNRSGAPVLLKRLGVISLIMLVNAGAIFPFLFNSNPNYQLINAYWPFQIGVIYLVNSLFYGRELTKIGIWLVFAAVISFIIPVPLYSSIWMAVAGGGGLIVTGVLLRKQVV